MRWIAFLIVVSLAGGIAFIAPGTQPAATPSLTAAAKPGREIAFMSDRGGPNPQIYVMRSNGTGARKVINKLGDEPSWSPDGRRIAFSRFYDDPTSVGSSIWVVNRDGSGERRLTRTPEFHFAPAWSPNGKRIVLEVWLENGGAAIAKVSSAGGKRKLLTTGDRQDRGPTWSPDGRRIAFSRGDGNRADLYIMRSDGSREHRLLRHAGEDLDPAFSPGGEWIAFGGTGGGGEFHLYLMRADGTGLRQMTSKRGGMPDWSPNSKRIVFASSRDGDSEIFVMPADGSGREHRLTDNQAADQYPSWRR